MSFARLCAYSISAVGSFAIAKSSARASAVQASRPFIYFDATLLAYQACQKIAPALRQDGNKIVRDLAAAPGARGRGIDHIANACETGNVELVRQLAAAGCPAALEPK